MVIVEAAAFYTCYTLIFKRNQNTRYFLHITNERDAYRGDQSKEAEKKEWSVKPVTESSSDCSSSPEESSERKIV